MKKLLLTSAALSNQKIKEALLTLAGRPLSSLKITFVASPVRFPEEDQYLQEAKAELIDLGVIEENTFIIYLDHPITYADFAQTDMVYVCGGNTYYILQQIRRFGFKQALLQCVDEGKIYFGVSAGSIIAGPSIDIAGVGDTADSNDADLTDTEGLDIVSFSVSPHYTDNDRVAVDQFEQKIPYEVIRLTDEQAIMVKGEKVTIIG